EELERAAGRGRVVLPEIAGLQIVHVEMPVGRGRLDREALRRPGAVDELSHADLRVVAVALRPVETGARDREGRARAGRDLPRGRDPRRLAVAVPEHLA